MTAVDTKWTPNTSVARWWCLTTLVKTYTDHMVLQGYYWYGGYESTKD